jgi:Tfp pilus assembly protein PilV
MRHRKQTTRSFPRWSREGDGAEAGFTLVEALIAMMIMTFGLLSAGQMLFVAAGSSSLSRSMDGAAIAAQSKLEFLSHLYNRTPDTSDLQVGVHGGDVVQVLNQSTHSVLNRFVVTWTVVNVTDPRVGKVPKAKCITVTVTPVDEEGRPRLRAFFNKTVTMSAILSVRLT